MPSPHRSWTRLLAIAVTATVALVTSTGLVVLNAGAAGAVTSAAPFVVAPSGDDANPGTAEQPFATVGRGLLAVQPGGTLLLRGGTYPEQVRSPRIQAGTATSPIRFAAWPGERPVIAGLLWLRGASHWTIDGINVTWAAGNGPTEHMVKMTNGVGWSFVNSEIWGARSYAGLLVAGTVVGEPANWRVADNCVRDTHATNSTNQDQLIYVNTGVTAGAGTIERNLLFNAPNGSGIKMGGPSADSGGAVNVTVRNNTIANTTQNILVSWQSQDNRVTSNLMHGTGPTYGNVRGYQLTGTGNAVGGNAGGGSRAFLLNDAGYTGLLDAGLNLWNVDPSFDELSCDGLRPGNPVAAAFGRYAGLAADATPPPVAAPATAPALIPKPVPAPAPMRVSPPSSPSAPPAPSPWSPENAAPAPRNGYRMVAADGGVFAFGDASFLGSTGDIKLNKPIVGMASTPSGRGYWLVASDGGIFAFGDAGFFGSTGDMRLNQPVVGMASTPTGRGYWMVASDGGIFAFGDAEFFGSTGDIKLNKPIRAMVATATHRGYWMVASDGGMFAFGDAKFFGSTGDRVLPAEIVGMAPSPGAEGYWLADRNGGVYAFGAAGDHGSAVAIGAPVAAIAAANSGGYWLARADGSIHPFGGAPGLGPINGLALRLPIVGLAAG